MKKALKITLLSTGGTTAAILLLIGLKLGSTAPPTTVLEPAVQGAPVGGDTGGVVLRATSAPVTLPDLVYFGAAWQMLNKQVGAPPLVLGAGYTNARVERTGDGLFFAGIVDRLDREGNVSDVVLAFGGAQAAGDFIQGEALAHGRVLAEPKWAAVLLERIWQDPRYAHARIHVTGHSLGAGYAIFAGMDAVARHGKDAVASRLSIVAFGVPNWAPQSARYFRLSPRALDAVFTGYTALNDPVITNGGTDRVGISNFLPPLTGPTGFSSMFNVVAAHWPTAYMTSLGLPDWLTPGQKAASIARVSKLFITGAGEDTKYGPPGSLPLVVEGSARDDAITGGSGDDWIAGHGGRDRLRGGGGNDRFVFLRPTDSRPGADTADQILDFGPGDRIDLSRMDADATKEGRQPFTPVSSRVFTPPGQVTTWSDGATTWIAGNVDRDPAADFLIEVTGLRRLTMADFVLVPQPGDERLQPYIDGKAAILRPN
ncbi:M10 family metallopeptidase C-terminal domain-containing protein [Novosphingobium sp. 9U]|uniref:M10 family metallopeptidase C-terminal domain-containing protein n=1 Tax=Novosphingobium sp. 9U TaxID=2653158 RepID=UPI00135A6258|nr:hypothetical protein [Novosphingobium sp. 9U]